MTADRRVGVIADPYGSGLPLVDEIRDAGFSPVALLSAPTPPPAYGLQYRFEDFDDWIIADRPMDEVIEAVRAFRPEFVATGTETGVDLVDAVAPSVTPRFANDPALARARRDKGAMVEAVAAAGLRAVRSLRARSHDDVVAWLERERLTDQPIVLKPPNSGGTDGVCRARPGEDWRPKFDALLGRRNKLACINETVIVQEFLVGQEYVIDTYSVDGRHIVACICKYRKVENGDHIAVYESLELLPGDPTPGGELLRYTFEVLDALGIRSGAAHTEVMVTADGPCHIETGARLHGGGQPDDCMLATGDSQRHRMVAHLTGQPVGGDYHLEKAMLTTFLIAPRAGLLTNREVLDRAASLPTHHRTLYRVQPNTVVSETKDLATAIGFVVLASESRDAVMRDYQAVKELEAAVHIEPVDALSGAR